MTARQVSYSQLTCDGCDLVFEHIGRPVAYLRDLAGKHGWKFRQQVFTHSHWNRRIDLCPKCEEPRQS